MLQYHRKRTEKQGGKREAETAKAHEGTRGREVKVAKRLLLVDDEAAIIKGLKFSLEQDGYEILTAYDGAEALEKFRSNHVDLILLDVMLPVMDGIEVCQRIREESNVPIIMLTAKGEDMDKILGLEYGADDYMTKPFNILEVKARIKTILRRMGAPREKEESNILTVHELSVNQDLRSVTAGRKSISPPRNLICCACSSPIAARFTAANSCWKRFGATNMREICAR